MVLFVIVMFMLLVAFMVMFPYGATMTGTLGEDVGMVTNEVTTTVVSVITVV